MWWKKILTRWGNADSITPLMKQAFSLLVAFVFLQVQSWALSGGPVYSGNQQSLVGTYAGTLIGNAPLGSTQTAVGANGLGIFVIGIPAAGVGSGVFAYFDAGVSFYGTIVGIADPDKLTLNALVQGQANQILTLNQGGSVVTVSLPDAFASGQLVADLEPRTSGVGSAFRMLGTATLNVRDVVNGVTQPGQTNTLTVDGFQQSTTVTGTVSLSSLTGAQ